MINDYCGSFNPFTILVNACIDFALQRLKICDWPVNSGCVQQSQEINIYPTENEEMTSAMPITKPTVGTFKPTTTTTTTTEISESVTEENTSTWKPSTERPSTTEDPWAWKPTTTTAATLPTTQSEYHLTGETDAYAAD